MPHNRFYSPSNIITDQELHHLTHVMRNHEGDTVELIDGKGMLATARIDTLTRREAHLTIIESTYTPPPETPKILIQGLPSTPAKLKLILEKCTELGIDQFHFFGAKTPSQDKLHHTLISALKQCGRLHLPSLAFHSHLQNIPLGPSYYGAPGGAPFTPGASTFVIGPESGLNSSEIKYLESKHSLPTMLSPHILRTETAAIIASFLIQPPNKQ